LLGSVDILLPIVTLPLLSLFPVSAAEQTGSGTFKASNFGIKLTPEQKTSVPNLNFKLYIVMLPDT
jgi:hypothetical protein